ncbi:MAG: NAD(P)H-dependent glycerol-3-phosphate dehydrogenase [Trueperaceae bacterium]
MSHAARHGTTADAPPAAPLAVLGAGAWGTVIASLLARDGHPVRLWTHRPDHAQRMHEERHNETYLPGMRLPPTVQPTSDLRTALTGVTLAFLAVPSRAVRGLVERLTSLPRPAGIVSCAKGIEIGTFRRLSEIIAQGLEDLPIAALSGPNLAGEIALGMPAATTVASVDAGFARRVQRLLHQPTFRVYTSDDVIGVETAGAFKNVIALAAGMSDGLGLGDNSKATIITRGLAELVRLGTALGGLPRTFYGLAGLGDMVATCTSARSRNHTAGERIARGATLAELEAEHLTAEGIPTVRAVHEHASVSSIDLPITREVYHVVYDGKDPHDAIADLMAREEKAE